ncbi:DUF6782 family putative metallopeptidase [Trueperella sp. LYQ143]|uniref:DUF6782 family putative metallopeptidase n=1 Tax=Trueperella sp. LYQ143 TaxID=3391059 RepID=UPI0039834C92
MLKTLLDQAARLGVQVCTDPRPRTDRVYGFYDHDRRMIVLCGIAARDVCLACAVLAHELTHAIKGHAGRQDEHVEGLCDSRAVNVISLDAYTTAARYYPDNMWAIASELGLPQRLICAYQQHLDSTRRLVDRPRLEAV